MNNAQQTLINASPAERLRVTFRFRKDDISSCIQVDKRDLDTDKVTTAFMPRQAAREYFVELTERGFIAPIF